MIWPVWKKVRCIRRSCCGKGEVALSVFIKAIQNACHNTLNGFTVILIHCVYSFGHIEGQRYSRDMALRSSWIKGIPFLELVMITTPLPICSKDTA